jgi:hypothetical protein
MGPWPYHSFCGILMMLELIFEICGLTLGGVILASIILMHCMIKEVAWFAFLEQLRATISGVTTISRFTTFYMHCYNHIDWLISPHPDTRWLQDLIKQLPNHPWNLKHAPDPARSPIARSQRESSPHIWAAITEGASSFACTLPITSPCTATQLAASSSSCQP